MLLQITEHPSAQNQLNQRPLTLPSWLRNDAPLAMLALSPSPPLVFFFRHDLNFSGIATSSELYLDAMEVGGRLIDK